MEPDADDAAMAQAMGFSSFGMQDRPLKKRRHDSGTTATVTDAQSNAAPLPRSNLATATTLPANTDEVPLDDDENVGGGDNKIAPGPPRQGSGPSGIASLGRSASLPERLPRAGVANSSSGHQPRQAGQRRPRGHLDDPSRGSWYEGYYDPLSNQNPWENLEQARGLQPKGSWLFPDLKATAAVSPAA